MSPLLLRRYRAERLLREEFVELRGKVLRIVRGRLRAVGVFLDPADLEACYSQAWTGLYAATLAGEEILNPTAWLALVSFRRAIEEHRAHSRARPLDGSVEVPVEGDLDCTLDDRRRLRELFEALRSRLSARECEAASLCYLQGLSRAQAAARMGISEARMRKLMEGRGSAHPGVAAKVAELAATIGAGGWCEEQSSLMRAFAFGYLDPDGERYRLAQSHLRECSACRAYVRSRRGLAAVLPPLPLPWVLGAAGVGAGATAGAGAGAGAGGGVSLVSGSLGTKLAVGCVVAVVGTGCVALTLPHARHSTGTERRHDVEARSGGSGGIALAKSPPSVTQVRVRRRSAASIHASVRRSSETRSYAAGVGPGSPGKAQREFGPEQGGATAPRGAGARGETGAATREFAPG